MPDTDMLNITKINCNTIGTHGNDTADNHSTNTIICQRSQRAQHYTNMMQDVDTAEKSCSNIDTISKFKSKDKPMVIDKEPNTINYFLPGPDQDNDKRANIEITLHIQREFKDVFNGISFFNGMFSMQLKPGSKPCQANQRCVTYALQKPFEKELE